MPLDASIQRRAFVLSTDGETAVGTSGSPIYFSLGLSGLNGSWTFNKEVAATISVAASTTTDTNGASLTITAAAGGATNSDGGALALDAGAKAGSGTDGAITIGTTSANAVTIGRSGKTTTVAGALAVTGATTLNGAVTLGDAAADDVTVSGVVAGNVTLKKEGAHTISIAASTTTDTNGGALTITAGAGGATNSDGGALTIDAGAKAGSGTDGAITIGGTNANSVAIGRSGKTTTVAGALAVTGASTLNGNVTLGDAAGDAVISTGAFTISNNFKIEEGVDAVAGTSATINKIAGTFILASGQTAFTLTNSYIAATSMLFATVNGGAAAAYLVSFVPGSGSAVATFSGAVGANTTVAFLVVNPT